jgi:hypothetical protein
MVHGKIYNEYKKAYENKSFTVHFLLSCVISRSNFDNKHVLATRQIILKALIENIR